MSKHKLYVASSWRNEYYSEVVLKLRESGWFAGKGKQVFAYIPQKEEPELMYKLFAGICVNLDELLDVLA